MSPAKSTARRLASAGALFTALGVIGSVSVPPALADQLVWGNAQAWVADGDVVTGYSTATGFGGTTEGSATADDVFGPMADYLEVDGESYTVVDDAGARAASTVRTASFRMGVADLAAHGMIDVPPDAALADPSPLPVPSPAPLPSSAAEPVEKEPAPLRDGPAPGDGGTVDGEGGTGTDGGVNAAPGGQEEAQAGGTPSENPSHEPLGATASPTASPTPSPSASPGEDDVFVLDETGSETVSADGNAVEFTLADVTTTATASYGGETGATFAHGDLTAFGSSVGPLEAGEDGIVVRDLLEVLDEDGDVVLEVPVSVRFVAAETAFGDEDPEWEGRGSRSWVTVWVQVGEPEEEKGFAVDFADSWVLGSTRAASTSPVPGDKGEGSAETGDAAGGVGRLATTGGSLAALITAAVVAVGGGSAATFLARKRTTAMDDRIG
ncbi:MULTISPECIES: hypothetical protein [unclassified Nocardiopsis]|uniref:hypothetical protein n=1 Tax=unclassified Nocardiopsis TaxID=2649073 RepID=UPI000B30ED9F|nr:hypothetical protein [Nocardiopsis sp. TSRI0078]